MTLRLWYEGIAVGELWDAIAHQGTWFAGFRRCVSAEEGQMAGRLCNYISFCEKWHRRLEEGESVEAAEFDEFKDIVESGLWRATSTDGSELAITEGPIFAAGMASWNHAVETPTSEKAAFKAWSRLMAQVE